MLVRIRGRDASPTRPQVYRVFICAGASAPNLVFDRVAKNKMNEESVRRLLRQVQAASQNRAKPGPGGFFAGGGLVLLVLGGLAVNASLFNGMRAPRLVHAPHNAYGMCLVVDGGHRAIKYTR